MRTFCKILQSVDHMQARLNLFLAWFFIPQTLAMGWLAAIGRSVLEMLGAITPEEAIPGRIVGALLLFGVLFVVQHFRGCLPPQGKEGGAGYLFGHRLLLVGNVMAALLFMFHFFAAAIGDYNTHLILEKVTTAFGYLALGCFAIGFSLLYQSSLPQEKS